jgi:hypothetical protein
MVGLPDFSSAFGCATPEHHFGLKSGVGPNARVVPKMALAGIFPSKFKESRITRWPGHQISAPQHGKANCFNL